jgi:hypothetical protein
MVFHSIAGQLRVVFLRPLVHSANVVVGEYTYYDSGWWNWPIEARHRPCTRDHDRDGGWT